MFHVPNEYRQRYGPMGSKDSAGNNGSFLFDIYGREFHVVAREKKDWEMIYIFTPGRTPELEEITIIREMFWDTHDVVIQYIRSRADEQYSNDKIKLYRYKKELAMPMGKGSV